MTLNLGNLWIELWNGSDAVLWLLTSALVNGLLVFLLYRGRHSLELLLSAKQVDLLLKFLILYRVCPWCFSIAGFSAMWGRQSSETVLSTLTNVIRSAFLRTIGSRWASGLRWQSGWQDFWYVLFVPAEEIGVC